MTCTYPNCRQPGQYDPVIEIPTVRSPGVIMPELRLDIINDAQRLTKFDLNRNVLIKQYEDMVQDAEERKRSVTVTDEPTYLIGKPICKDHKDKYNLSDWFSASDWKSLQASAREHGFFIDSQAVIAISFKPAGWEPHQQYIEVVR